MSKELEMLRKWCELTNAPETIDLSGNRVRRASLGIADLRRILARMEAAERVCAGLREYVVYDDYANYKECPSCGGTSKYDFKEALLIVAHTDDCALRAYRALDGKGEG